jgi:hypothetical protein
MAQLQIFQCPACGANINYNGGPEVTFPCQFCGTSIGVPEELRSHGSQAAPAGPETYAPEAPLGGVVLTGLALNIKVVDWLLNQASVQTGMRLVDDPMVYERISKAAEKAMRELFAQEAVTISLPFLTADGNGPKHFQTQLTRPVVDDLARDLNRAQKPAPKKKGLFGF